MVDLPDEQSPNFEDRTRPIKPGEHRPDYPGTYLPNRSPEVQAAYTRFLAPYDDPAVYGKYLGLPRAVPDSALLPPSASDVALPQRVPMGPRFADLSGSSPNFEDRTAAMGATPNIFGFGKPRGQLTPRDEQAPGLWVQGGSPPTPRDPQREAMDAAMNAMGGGGALPIGGVPAGAATPRPVPPISQGTNAPRGSPTPPEWYPQAKEFWDRGYGGDVPILGPTAGLQLGPPPTPMPNLRLTPVTGDPFAIPGT